MKKISLFLLLNMTLSFSGFSLLKDVELVYDDQELFTGDTVLFRLKSSNHKGKVFKSDVSSKYDCNEFEISVSKGGKIISKSAEGFKVYIFKSLEYNIVQIDLKYYYGFEPKFNFKIPISNLEDNIEGFKIVTNTKTITTNSKLELDIVVELQSGNLINVNADLEENSIYKLTVIQGGKLIDNKTVLVGDVNNCDSILKIEVALKEKPWVKKTEIYVIRRKPKIVFDFDKFSKAGLQRERNDRFDFTVNVEFVYSECSLDSILKIDIYNAQNRLLYTKYLSLNNEILIIDVAGGDGKDGRNGGNGYSKNINGGNGTDGEDGIDGGNVLITYSSNVKKYLSKIVILNDGGTGGRYGKGGKASRVTVHDYNSDHDRTVYGTTGVSGREGRDGRKGKINFVLVK